MQNVKECKTILPPLKPALGQNKVISGSMTKSELVQ